MIPYLKRQASNIFISTITGLFGMAIYFLIELSTGKKLDAPQKVLILLLSSALVFAVLSTVFEAVVKYYIKPQLENEIRFRLARESEISLEAQRQVLKKELEEDLDERTGITKIFNNFYDCENEIIQQLETSKEIRVLLQLGKTVLAGSTSFYDYLSDKRLDSKKKIKILHADINNPYLSERVARGRKSDFNEWRLDLEHARNKLDSMAVRSGGQLEGRSHKEGFFWRMFIFDDFAYIQPYTYERKNSERAPVLRLSRLHENNRKGEEINGNSMYRTFSKYFDIKWDECAPRVTDIRDLIPRNDRIAVASIVRYSEYYLFVIPSRYIGVDENEIPFHGIGGKVNNNENFLDAIVREVKEEVNLDIHISASPETAYYTSAAQLSPIALSDTPRPYCIYKRTRQGDINFLDADTLWIIGYTGELDETQVKLKDIYPHGEVGAIVILTAETLIKTLVSDFTYNDIQKAGDGSQVIHRASNFNYSAKAVPAGLASICAAELGRRSS
jgi:NUDIX domain